MGILWDLFEILVIVFENALICFYIKAHFPAKFTKKINVLISAAAIATNSAVYVCFLYVPQPWLFDGFFYNLTLPSTLSSVNPD